MLKVNNQKHQSDIIDVCQRQLVSLLLRLNVFFALFRLGVFIDFSDFEHVNAGWVRSSVVNN